MAIVFPKNNQIKGVKGSFQQSGATRDVSSSAKKNISTASHTSIFGGLHAKHSPNWVAGVKVSGDISKNDFQSVRFQRNSRTFRMNTGGFGTNIVSKQTVKTDNSFMTASLIGQIVNGAFGTLNKILDANAATTTKKTDKPSTDGTRDGQSVGNTTTFTGKLTSSKSFTELNNLESEVKTKKEGFQGSYDKLFADGFASLKADGASEALQALNVDLDTSSLTLTNNLDMSNIDAAMESIDGDIDKFKNFKANIPAKKTEVTNKKNQAQAKVNKTKVDVENAEKDVQSAERDYNDKKGKLDEANGKLPGAEKAVTDAKTKVQNLENSKSNIQGQLNSLPLDDPKRGELTAQLNEIENKILEAKTELANAERAKRELDTQIQTLTGKVATAEQAKKTAAEKLTGLKDKLAKEEKELKQCETAEKALAGVEKECDQIVESLEDKKAELKDIKKFEEEVKDKKYDLAKEQDKKLGEAVNEYKKVQEEINRLSVDENGGAFDKSDTKRADKLNKLNSKLASLGADINTLISSLSAAGSEPIANNKGETYTIQNLDDAQQLMSGGSSS